MKIGLLPSDACDDFRRGKDFTASALGAKQSTTLEMSVIPTPMVGWLE